MKKHIIPLFFILITFTACKPDFEDWNSLPDSWFTPCDKDESCLEDVHILDLGCFAFGGYEMVIDDSETYNSLKRPVAPYCDDFSYPEIDFEKYTLLIKRIDALGCKNPKIEYKVILASHQHQYYVYITVHMYGGCTVNHDHYISLLIPKNDRGLPISYVITNKMHEIEEI